MKKLLTKEMVLKAIADLGKAGKRTTVQAIHAAVGNQGSLTTVCKFKREIDAETAGPTDSEDALLAFRSLWSKAVAEGMRAREEEVADLQISLDAVIHEAQALEGQIGSATERIQGLEREQADVASEFAKAMEQVTAARQFGEKQAQKLADALERTETLQIAHAQEIANLHQHEAEAVANLRRELESVKARNHELEIELARSNPKRNDGAPQSSTPSR